MYIYCFFRNVWILCNVVISWIYSCQSSCWPFVSFGPIRPSWLHEMILPSFVSFPVLHFFGKPSGTVRDAPPVPCVMHHAHSPSPWLSPIRPLSPSFRHQFANILSAFIQNRAYSEKSSPEVLPVSQKCVPLHSLSEREAQATSEWIFDRLRTANKTRQRWDVVSAKQEVNSR